MTILEWLQSLTNEQYAIAYNLLDDRYTLNGEAVPELDMEQFAEYLANFLEQEEIEFDADCIETYDEMLANPEEYS